MRYPKVAKEGPTKVSSFDSKSQLQFKTNIINNPKKRNMVKIWEWEIIDIWDGKWEMREELEKDEREFKIKPKKWKFTDLTQQK